jgi:AAA15 family ATPase/GTPase
MLVEFRLKNYRCFRDQQTLSLVASSDNSLPNNVIEPNDLGLSRLRLLRSVVVYGPNASGKSKLLEALFFAGKMVVNSASAKPNMVLNVEPFLLDKSTHGEPSEFEFTFIDQGIRYQYGFAVDKKRVYREYLYAAPKGRVVLYFERTFDQEDATEAYRFGSSLKGQNQRISELTRPNALFLSVAATFKHPMLTAPYTWFSDKLEGTQAHMAWISPSKPDEAFHALIRTLLQISDIGISDYSIIEAKAPANSTVDASSSMTDQSDEGPDSPEGAQRFRIEMLHATRSGEQIGIDLSEESHGTMQLFFLATPLLRALAEGQILFVDELDTSKHPLLVRALVQLFHNPEVNTKNAQLIFNTHDTSLLDQELFRRDQVWFTEKGQDGASHLYSLLEYSPRRGESLAKGYLQGRYGAIPFLGDVSLLSQEECV